MSLCPICQRVLCGHSAEERNQTLQEMLKPLTNDELEIFKKNNEKTLDLHWRFDESI